MIDLDMFETMGDPDVVEEQGGDGELAGVHRHASNSSSAALEE